MPYGAANVRPARAEDARAIAEVHVASSRTTYKGIFPEAHLERYSIDKRETFWRETLTAAEPALVTLVGCDDRGEVVGFIHGGGERTGRLGCDGEIHVIYLIETAQRQGLGTLLARRFVDELRSRGHASMAVWVLALNPFRKFYEALGGRVIAEQEIERGGQSFTEIAYGWSDLSTFGR
ncbi:MAG TPA: GNAT family N-acetyltransferase [Bryobacteraceae bacterium]|nr:GNAT family N-acetyltransferase [Bryobacteraceae bacterium]